jgi:hypothetical protein
MMLTSRPMQPFGNIAAAVLWPSAPESTQSISSVVLCLPSEEVRAQFVSMCMAAGASKPAGDDKHTGDPSGSGAAHVCIAYEFNLGTGDGGRHVIGTGAMATVYGGRSRATQRLARSRACARTQPGMRMHAAGADSRCATANNRSDDGDREHDRYQG